MKINWKWPSTPSNDYAPWYLILLRCLLYVAYTALVLLASVLLLCGWGRGDAARFLSDAWLD